MGSIIEVLVICLILSIDVSLISFNYGLSKIKIPILSAISIALINLIAAGIGIIISYYFSNIINEIYLDYLSILLLFCLGLFNFIKSFFQTKEENLDKNNDHILSPTEAVILSLILIPDGFCASLSCGTNGVFIVSFIFLFLITTFLSVFVFSYIGFNLSKKIKLNLSWLSPICLIAFAILKFITLVV